jgi:hypothetical protein
MRHHFVSGQYSRRNVMKANWMLCLAAGIIGGVVSHYAWAPSVSAQIVGQPRQVRAQEFVITDEHNQTEATLTVTEVRGREVFEILGNDGQVIWSAGGGLVHPLAIK